MGGLWCRHGRQIHDGIPDPECDEACMPQEPPREEGTAAREASLLTAARSVLSALEAFDVSTLSGPQGVTVWQAIRELRKAVENG